VGLAPEDAFLVSELMMRPGVSVRLVAVPPESTIGTGAEQLLGIPLTRDLGDLTRQIFDLALMGSSSSRRTEIERVLAISGTPVLPLESFLAGEIVGDRIDAFQPAKPATAVEHPRPPAPAGPGPARPVARPEPPAHPRPPVRPAQAATPPVEPGALSPDGSGGSDAGYPEATGEMPLPDEPASLERSLTRWMLLFGATSAELHGGDAEHIEWICRTGPEDPLLKSIISLAIEHDGPQVMGMLDGFQRGRAWAAWPFRTGLRRGVLAASGIDPEAGRDQWERIAHDLATAWERRDRERAGPSFPMVPGVHSGWLSTASFWHRLSLAVERNRRDGLPFAVHRVALNGPPECVESFSQVLPQKLRDTDCVCRPLPGWMLLLIAEPASSTAHVRNRIANLWQECWQAHRGATPAAPLAVERAELRKPEDADVFMATARGWLAGT
jgi:hypothetical protein